MPEPSREALVEVTGTTAHSSSHRGVTEEIYRPLLHSTIFGSLASDTYKHRRETCAMVRLEEIQDEATGKRAAGLEDDDDNEWENETDVSKNSSMLRSSRGGIRKQRITQKRLVARQGCESNSILCEARRRPQSRTPRQSLRRLEPW